MGEALAARRIVVTGRVQGVGFRPYVYRRARDHGLAGWVRNGAGEVHIHVEGPREELVRFELALVEEAPPLARARLEASAAVPATGARDFVILASRAESAADVHLPPDLFCCDECLAELADPRSRRHRYPFTNCTQCGPRYTIIESLPYDRPSTSMASFALCPDCRREYEDAGDRRFHAQPLACPRCGPQLALAQGGAALHGEPALDAALERLRAGAIVAVKGVGGYHLLCDAASDAAVARLRERKRRPAKPLAVMFPLRGADGLDAVRAVAHVGPAEARALSDPARPIVLVAKRGGAPLSRDLAPGLNEIGAFLPYSPLHALLLEGFAGPLVATSGNVGGEPVLVDNAEAEARLANVADAFLHHDRPILRPADDSVVRVVQGKARPIRVGRGLGPLEAELPHALPHAVLAAGGHMKNAIALGWGRRAVLAPHIGDLDSLRSLEVLARVAADLQRIHGVPARSIACDLHPGYGSTRWSLAQGLPVVRVQHHRAHASAIAAEHPEVARWLAFAWDGFGLGDDGTLWGGEAFAGSPGRWRRVASIRPFRVTGGDRAAREPWRSAASLLWECNREWTPPVEDAALARAAWRNSVNAATTSSAGRLFDAAAALILGIGRASFEGEAPMLLESVVGEGGESIELPIAEGDDGILRLDWEPLVDVARDASLDTALRARIVHNALADALVAQAAALSSRVRFEAVGLTGGVFQNRRLAERAARGLEQCGMRVYLPQAVPANDGGLAFGQLVEAAAVLAADAATVET